MLVLAPGMAMSSMRGINVWVWRHVTWHSARLAYYNDSVHQRMQVSITAGGFGFEDSRIAHSRPINHRKIHHYRDSMRNSIGAISK